jgi:5-methylcytosine-specific restriction endonuclease McrA
MDNKKTLLLNYTDEIIAFIKEKKALRLVYKGKADVISVWENIRFRVSTGVMCLPAVIKLKYYVYRKFSKIVFSRLNVLKRDKYSCQYCGKVLKSTLATIDHVLPKALGGQYTFENCVVACKKCNSKKSSKTLEESGMKLIREPCIPSEHMHYMSVEDGWHDTWSKYITK